MALENTVVKVAASQIGVKESPANSNRVKYWNEYDKSMQGQPWCCCFVWWVFKHASASKYFYGGKRAAYCPYVVSQAKKAGTWKGRDYKPVPGDVILFANKGTACHVGIVEKRISSTQVQTIEGNTSAGNNANGGQVQRRIRTYGEVGSSWYILGFVHPSWPTGKVAKTKVSKYTKYKVVTKSDPLNCREEPNTKSAITRTIAKGKTVQVAEIRDGWALTKKGDWCSAKYLAK